MSLVKLISTGSLQGNCYQYKNIIFDLGISYTKLKKATNISEIDYIFISHSHGDHMKTTAITQIRDKHPNIKFLIHDDLSEYFEKHEVNHFVLEPNKGYRISGITFQLVKLYHDVNAPCFGIKLNDEVNNIKGIYITDTYTVEGVMQDTYDFIIIEYNHNEEQALQSIESTKEGEFNHLVGSVNSHLNFNQSDEFINNNSKKGTEILKCHLSSSYNEDLYDLHYVYESEETYKGERQ